MYRGRLFTTDFAYSKGVIHIQNNDFSEVLKSIDDSKGFKNGRICDSIEVGFSFRETVNKMQSKINNPKYKHIVILGIEGHSIEEEEYYKSFLKHAPSEMLIISLSYCKQKENRICLNSSIDSFSMLKVIEQILDINENIKSIFFPYIDRHTLSIILNLCTHKNTKIYIGKSSQNIINPTILESLKNEFGILEISSPKKDLEKIIEEN